MAQTAKESRSHPSAYGIHKYWSRKCASAVRRALSQTSLSGRFIDPFAGSGVPLSEAAALGFTCRGGDVNPIAVRLSRLTLNPPDPADVRPALAALCGALETEFGGWYETQNGPLRYAVHASITRCPGCARSVAADLAHRAGRRYTCPACGARLRFGLDKLEGTAVRALVTVNGARSEPSRGAGPDLMAYEAQARSCDHPFAHNCRLLCFRGLTTRRLFTPRNFALLARAAECIEALADGPVREALRLHLTGSLAQCSRLVAFRGGLRTGGPAWTVPGFWVPPMHLETNPLVHLRARERRFLRGLAELCQMPGRGRTHQVEQVDARALLGAERGGAAVVFLDPPYGDSVPFLEFSALWNSFQGGGPDPEADLSVSDRVGAGDAWGRYAAGLAEVALAAAAALRPGGRLIATFNNNDARAWGALLGALQAAGFRCLEAAFEPPAVVPAKAQLAPEGSYLGDFYCHFAQSPLRPSTDLTGVLRAVQAAGHSGALAVRREALKAWLSGNVAADLLPELGAILTSPARRRAARSARERRHTGCLGPTDGADGPPRA